VAAGHDRPHVLCVDPQDAERERTLAALAESPVSVTGADGAARARAVAAETPVDALVTERHLSDGDGLGLAERLDVPTVVYTGDGDERFAGAAVDAGVAGYVTKAEGPERLRERLEAVVPASGGDGAADDSDEETVADAPATVEDVPFAVVEWDRDGAVVDCNERATALFERDRATLVGPEGGERLFGAPGDHGGLDAALAGETARVVERTCLPSGETVTCEWHTTPRIVDGEVVGAVSYVRSVGDGARRVESLEMLRRTTRELLRADSPEAVGEAVLEAAESVLRQPVSTMRLYDEDSGELELVAATDEARALFEAFPPVGPDDGVVWDAYESGRRRHYEDVDADETVHDGPLPIGDAVIQPLSDHGVITFGHSATGTLDETDRQLARVLATTAEAALDRAAVREQLRERKGKIERLHGVIRELETCESADDVWELAVDAAEGILEFDECGVDEAIDGYLVSRATSSELLPDGYVERTPIIDGIAGETHRTGETYLIDDLGDSEEATPESETYRSLLSVPIGDRGVFQAVSGEVGAFDDEDAELAELLLGHVGNALDRLAAEAELREERDRFAALFENVPDPVVFADHDEDGRPIVRTVNGAFEETFGLDEETIRGEDLDEYVVPPGRREEGREIEHIVAEEGQVVEREVTRRTEDGLREFLLTVAPMELDQRNERTFGVYTDITERKQRQQRVEVLNRVLRHDLRNGMNIIKGAAETIDGTVEADERRELARSITERANDLLETAEKTRAVERTLDRDRGPVEPVDAVAATEAVCDAVRSEYPDATVRVDAPERAAVTADEMLETALYHVLENAVVHNDRDPEVDVRVAVDGDDTTITVADNGPGIPDSERELVAEDREITQLNHASGLGLWLVNWVVTRAGGSLSFTDRESRGTAVELRLPTADAAAESEPPT
jgi:PAS domain S-box-containing protein